MAAKKYDWGDGKGQVHTIPLAAHQANMAAQRVVAPAAPPKGIGGQVLLGPGAPPPKGLVGQVPLAAQGAIGGAPAANPGVSAGTPATTPTAGQITPDAAYLARAAQAAFQRTTQLNRLHEEGKDDSTNTQTAISRMIENALKDRSKISEGAGKEGLFYSGQLTKRLGDYETELKRSRDDVQTSFDQREAARIAARKAIEAGAPIDDAAELSDAVTRQIGRDTTAADLGALVPNVNTGPASTQVAAVQQLINRQAGSPRTGQSYTVQAGKGGSWHIYPNGKKVWVPKRR